MKSWPTRRKAIAISGAAGGLLLLPRAGTDAAALPRPVAWTGLFLGCVASIRLYHPDPARGKELIERAVQEARRLEAIFSLYRDDSVIAQLNRASVLVAPPEELVDLLRLCDRIWHATGAAFDPTVQPLWQCYLEHFSRSASASGAPPADHIERSLARVGWQRVRFDRDRITLERGMALTLNGVAQGYVTDRVVDVLRSGGIRASLVDMGEIRCLGCKPGGEPWRIAVGGSSSRAPLLAPEETADKAVATSAADGFTFNTDATSNHLFDPRTGLCARPGRSIGVVTATAAEADALSTAFTLMDDARIAEVLPLVAPARAHVVTPGSAREILAAGL